MNLTANFTLEEMSKSPTAIRYGLVNIPSHEAIESLTLLCIHILQPLRNLLGPIAVNSGYRSPEVNKLVGSQPNSQHILGEAADIEAHQMDNYQLAKFITENNFPFDQLILEGYTKGSPESGWVHVSYSPSVIRRSVLTASLGEKGMIYERGLHQ